MTIDQLDRFVDTVRREDRVTATSVPASDEPCDVTLRPLPSGNPKSTIPPPTLADQSFQAFITSPAISGSLFPI